MSAPGRATRSTRSGGPGSTSSPTGSGSATSPSLSTTTRGCWSGPRKAATRRQSPGSSPSSAGTERRDRARLERHGRVDHPRGRRAVPASDALPRPVPYRRARQRRPGRGTARGLERGQTLGRHRRRALPQGLPLGALETTRTTDRAAAAEARDDREGQPAALPRLPAERAAPARLPRAEPEDAVALLEAWLAWARRCRIPSFIKLAKTITANKQGIVATLTHRLSNARVEAINTTLRLISRRAYGFHSADALIALAMLTVGGLRPPLPGRA